jgi:hypothetical protein
MAYGESVVMGIQLLSFGDKSPLNQLRYLPDLMPFDNSLIYKHFMKTAMQKSATTASLLQG